MFSWIGYAAYIKIFLIILTSYFIYLINEKRKRERNYPPGPIGLPYVGYLPFIPFKEPQEIFLKLGLKYGDVYSLMLGPLLCIVLNSTKAIKECLSKLESAGRPTEWLLNVEPEHHGPFFESGKFWREHRAFAIQTFKDMGLRKSLMDDLIMDEIQHFLKGLAERDGKDTRVRNTLFYSGGNVITRIFFSKRFAKGDSERKRITDCLFKTHNDIERKYVIGLFPWMRIFFRGESAKNEYNDYYEFIRKEIKERRENPKPENERDFLERYLDDMEPRKERDPKTTFSEKAIPLYLAQIFFAGSDTIRHTLFWSLYTFASYPDVQRKIQEEIDKVIGVNGTPCFSDQDYMPYTYAALMEVQRMRTVTPFAVPHMATSDISVQGYTVPAGTVIIANLSGVHMRPDYWNDPEKYTPERFLSSDGKTLLKNENYIPFSYGKRVCLGEAVGVMATFLYITSILQKFRVCLPEGETPDFRGRFVGAFGSDKSKLRFLPRH